MALQVAPSSILVGSHVWVEDPDVAWIDGEVKEVKGEEITVDSTSGKTIVAKRSNVYPKDPEFPSCGVDDMTRLAYLHEPGVLQNLKCRYDINEIYTYTGNILIAVNPFRRLPHLYSSHMMEQYKGAAFGELSPHPFAVADASYRHMINEGISQSILVSGESGAGKTESTKMLMRYLAYMGGRVSKAEERSVEQKVLESNPVLEAFGNAKTVRNNNSSRFGKFVEIQFDPRGQISGAAIRTYLLERSRVCQVSDPERNYHCFYMLCAAPPEEVEKYKLGNPRTFHYLNQSNCYELDGVDSCKEYLLTKRAMDVVGISQGEQDGIFRVVAAILHLGNIEFKKGQEIDSAEPKDDKSRFHLKTAAELLMCNEKALEDSLCKRVMVTRDESITKSLDPVSAALSRDALAKIVYSKLFDWLVDKINVSISQDPESKSLIGVLDIYGFESFKTNSFEQFCINLTNEKLQQHFNQHVFKMEQEEYKKEEIDWSYIEFIDNQDILDLIEKKPGGIIALLDEACMFPRSTHETFAQKLYQTFKDNKRFSKPKLSRTDFTICHYAGDVTYQTELFLDKNKDYVVSEHQALLNASECSFVSSLFPPSPEESSKTTKFSSIGSSFKQQLQALLETLSATEPHYIRCVKPNNALKPGIFENQNVLQQLRCGGVMEAIRISCAGFPSRKSFREFVARFSLLAPEVLSKRNNYTEVTASKKILEKSKLSGYQIGKTKVFLRAGQMAELDALRTEILGRSASLIQRKVRTYLCRKRFILLRLSAIQIQALCRGQVARHQYEEMRREAAALNIQKHLRKFLARKAYKNLYFSAVSIQTGMRGMIARSELLSRKQTRAATVIQSHCRRFLANRRYLRLKKAAITTQCAWRARVARKELRKLRMAARETGALQEAKTKLEKEVEELTWRLQLEKRTRVDLEESKKQESARFESTLQKMQLEFEESKKKESARFESNLQKKELEFEESKKQESERFESTLHKMQLEFEESKKQESERFESTFHKMQLEFEESKKQESARFESTTQKMQLEFEESKKQERARFESTLHRKELQFQQLQFELQKLQLEFEESKKQERETLESTLHKKELEFQESKKQERATFESTLYKKELEFQELQVEFQKMQLELEKTKELLIKEREAAKKIAEQVPAVQEIPVIDDELVNKLTAENEQLKALGSSLEQKINETERKYEETNKLSEERLKQGLEAESKIVELKTEMQRLEKKILDMGAEDQKPQQQAIPSAPSKNMSEVTSAEIPVVDDESMNKPTVIEDESMNKHTVIEDESMNKHTVIDDESMNKLTPENEQLKILDMGAEDQKPQQQAMLSSLSTTISEVTSAIRYISTFFPFILLSRIILSLSQQVPVVQEIPVIENESMNKPTVNDDESMNKLTAEKEQLKILDMGAEDQKPQQLAMPSSLSTTMSEVTSAEIPVIDNESMNKPTVIDDGSINRLIAENEQLKALVSTLEQKINETERKYEETKKLSDERLKQTLEAESKIIELKTTVQRLEEKILDMETDQKSQQQALLSTPSRKMPEPLENGHHAQLSSGPSTRLGREDSKLRRSQTEKQQPESVDDLLKCVAQNLGFSQEKPVAAFTIYKCLLHWKSFEAEKTSVFDRLIEVMGSALEDQDNNDHMAYWLSNTSSLLFLLQRSLKASGSMQKPPAGASFFARMTKSFRSSSANLQAGVLSQVEAKYPALLFKQQLSAYVEKIYGIIRDNLKKNLSPLISGCIQVPRISKGAAFQKCEGLQGYHSPAGLWQSIIECLNKMMGTLKDNFVPPILVQNIFTQTFAYINVQLFNSLLLRRECCTFSNGEYVKSGLAELELWCAEADVEYVGPSWDELKHTRQAVGFLVINQKSKISFDEISKDLCSALSVQQLYRVCTLYRDDNYNTQSVSPDVLAHMKELMSDDTEDDGGSSFLLEDDISIPFTMEDISNCHQVKEFASVRPAEELMTDPAFQFLQD
ncbi:hypothetical protein ES288_A09G236400v1 [Gossypium darwinii]|uniref:Myosin motor domain-containing protein n=1 Tax=Gossypium darwinii TaxID=34276 RepID=A0A5D2FE77_GOSDA|nr:hypothetical protein ES288_A09G236400v1 [Gossypium darwinii]